MATEDNTTAGSKALFEIGNALSDARRLADAMRVAATSRVIPKEEGEILGGLAQVVVYRIDAAETLLEKIEAVEVQS